MKIGQLFLLLGLLPAFGQSYEQAVHQADSMTRRYANQIFNRAAVTGIYFKGNDSIIAKGRINSMGRRTSESDVFQIGSVTKTVTGFMLSKALVEGKLSLDMPISPYIHIRKKAKFDSVTLYHLVTHTSGLPHNSIDFLGPTYLAGAVVGIIKNQLILGPMGASAALIYTPWHSIFIPPLPHYSTYGKGALNEDLRLSRLKKFGTYKYSNIGYGIIGNILAEYHDTNYEGLLQQEFCAPLAFTETSTKPKHFEKGTYATPHDFFGVRMVRTQFAEGGMEGAGDVKMTASDMMKYLKLQMDEDHPLAHIVEYQQQTQFQTYDKKHKEMEVGIAWLKKVEPDGTEILWHHDHLLGTSAFIGFIPEKEIGIFLLANNAKARKLTKIGFWWLRQQLKAE